MDLFCCYSLKFISNFFPLQWKLHRLVLLLLLVFVQPRLDAEAALHHQKISGCVFCSLKQSTILLRRNVIASGWKHGFIFIASISAVYAHNIKFRKAKKIINNYWLFVVRYYNVSKTPNIQQIRRRRSSREIKEKEFAEDVKKIMRCRYNIRIYFERGWKKDFMKLPRWKKDLIWK